MIAISIIIAIILLIFYIEYTHIFKFVVTDTGMQGTGNTPIPVNTNDEETIKLFKNAVEFSSVKLRECSIPRTELVTIQTTDSLELLTQKFMSSGYSKVLVYEDSIDNIIGYVHISDMFKHPQSITEIIRPIQFVPETMNAKKLMKQLIQNKQSIAVVVDEFGGTSGVVTIEDIIEEIFGEIKDEFDTITLEERKLPNNEFIFSARHEIDYINEKYELNLPSSDDYDTLAGLFLYHHQKFPHINASIIIEQCKLTILKISGTRLELIHIKKI
jgi:CBS domain containing-hemolysin-like protein